jgi:steroid 5-alpha reductase family enzyme
MSKPGSAAWNRTSALGIVAALGIGAALAFAGSQGSVEVGGLAVFALGGIIAYSVNLLAFVPSFLARTEKFYDATGSFTYLAVTAIALTVSDDIDARAVVVAAMVAVWAIRLGSFLFARIRRDGSDGRFDTIRGDFLRFLMTWMLQGLWVFLTLAAALAIITSDDRDGIDIFAVVGIVVWLIGFVVEVTADAQKSAFRADPANEGRFITTGLWAWSRHPNYFGEITLWLGISIMAVPVLSGWRWAVLVSPLFVYTLLTRVSGVPLLEYRARKRWGDEPEFVEYTKHTPTLFPKPPKRQVN